MEAKIDTGADVSSINATIIQTYRVGKDNWLRLQLKNNNGQNIILQKKIIRYTKVKRKSAASIKRPVIELDVCIGKQYHNIEVNLSNRENFKYQMLIGRNFLKGKFLVDVEMKNLTKPDSHQIMAK